MDHDEIVNLFHMIDTDGSGYIEPSELATLAPGVDLEQLINELDADGDGRISLAELEKGLDKITKAGERRESCDIITDTPEYQEEKFHKKLVRRYV